MAENMMSEARGLDAPESVNLTASHPRGPWAGSGQSRLQVPSRSIAFRNSGSLAAEIHGCDFEPLRQSENGSTARAVLSASLDSGESWPVSLAPGEVLSLSLKAEGQLPPGRYASRLRLLAGEGKVAAGVPVSLTIRAHPFWALISMVLGLLFLGLLLLLAGRATLNERLAETLAEQQRLHEWLEGSPPTLATRPVATRAKEELAMAIESLSQPRSVGLGDSRLQRAERHLREARLAATKLHSMTGDQSSAQLAVSVLDEEWKHLLERIQKLRWQLAPGEPGKGGSELEFPRLLHGVLRAQWQGRIIPLLLATEQTLGAQVERVKLALAAGEQERARQLAQLVSVWLRRAARELDQESNLLLSNRSMASAAAAKHYMLQQAQADEQLAAPARQELSGALRFAQTQLAAATLAGFRDAQATLEQAHTALVRARSDQLYARLQSVSDEVEARTSLRRIEAAIDQLPADVTPEQRVDGLLVVIDRWRERVETVPELQLREQLSGQVEALRTLIAAGDLAATEPGFRELLDGWIGYQNQQTEQARAAVILPYCQDQQVALRLQHAAAEETLALLQPHPDLDGLDAILDRAGAVVNENVDGSDCMEKLHAVSGELLRCDDVLLSNFLMRADVPREQRLADALHSESQRAIAVARRLMQEARPLRLRARTPEEEIRTDRRVAFEIGDLDPTWGSGVMVRVDFGDGSAPVLRNAEQLRQEPVLQHRYPQPGRVELRVLAVPYASEATDLSEPEVVGEGSLSLNVLPSPISLARSLANFFLSVRFALALALGLLIQGWRFYDQRPFGCQTRDYVEAFALGMGAQGLVEGLMVTLVQIIQVG